MKETKIIVDIDRDGRVTADADGFSGEACLTALDKLLEGLGLVQESVERKPDAGNRYAGVVRRRQVGTGRKP